MCCQQGRHRGYTGKGGNGPLCRQAHRLQSARLVRGCGFDDESDFTFRHVEGAHQIAGHQIPSAWYCKP